MITAANSRMQLSVASLAHRTWECACVCPHSARKVRLTFKGELAIVMKLSSEGKTMSCTYHR